MPKAGPHYVESCFMTTAILATCHGQTSKAAGSKSFLMGLEEWFIQEGRQAYLAAMLIPFNARNARDAVDVPIRQVRCLRAKKGRYLTGSAFAPTH